MFGIFMVPGTVGSVDYVKGDLVEKGTPLPQIPPLNGRVGLSYESGSFSVQGGIVSLIVRNVWVNLRRQLPDMLF